MSTKSHCKPHRTPRRVMATWDFFTQSQIQFPVSNSMLAVFSLPMTRSPQSQGRCTLCEGTDPPPELGNRPPTSLFGLRTREALYSGGGVARSPHSLRRTLSFVHVTFSFRILRPRIFFHFFFFSFSFFFFAPAAEWATPSLRVADSFANYVVGID